MYCNNFTINPNYLVTTTADKVDQQHGISDKGKYDNK